MKIQNAFRLGLFGGLGVLVAIVIGQGIGSLATILTYVGAALFLALGIDPAVSFLQRHRFPRSAAILTVLVAVATMATLNHQWTMTALWLALASGPLTVAWLRAKPPAAAGSPDNPPPAMEPTA